MRKMKEFLTDAKTAAAVSATTISTGLGTIFDYIPDNIGKLATLVGICLSLVLIRVHLQRLKKEKEEYEKAKIEKQMLEMKLKEMKLTNNMED